MRSEGVETKQQRTSKAFKHVAAGIVTNSNVPPHQHQGATTKAGSRGEGRKKKSAYKEHIRRVGMSEGDEKVQR